MLAGHESPPGLLHYLLGHSYYKPLFATTYWGWGGRSKSHEIMDFLKAHPLNIARVPLLSCLLAAVDDSHITMTPLLTSFCCKNSTNIRSLGFQSYIPPQVFTVCWVLCMFLGFPRHDTEPHAKGVRKPRNFRVPWKMGISVGSIPPLPSMQSWQMKATKNLASFSRHPGGDEVLNPGWVVLILKLAQKISYP